MQHAFQVAAGRPRETGLAQRSSEERLVDRCAVDGLDEKGAPAVGVNLIRKRPASSIAFKIPYADANPPASPSARTVSRVNTPCRSSSSRTCAVARSVE